MLSLISLSSSFSDDSLLPRLALINALLVVEL